MIKKAVAIIALVMIASLSVAGCAQSSTTSSPSPTPFADKKTDIGNNTTYSSTAGFNITYPKTLNTSSSTNASQSAKIFVYLAKNKSLNSVSVSTMDAPNMTLSDFTTYNLNSVNDFPNYKLISNNSTTLGGKPAYTVVWQAIVPLQMGDTASTKDTTLKAMQTYQVNNNIGYVVSYQATLSDYNTYLKQAQQIMNSFKLTS